MLAVDTYSQHVVGRLLDFFGSGTPWQRRLWDIGTVLALKEAIEASEARHAAILTDDALKYLTEALRESLKNDLGLSVVLRNAIQGCLQGALAAGGSPYLRLKQLVSEVERTYLDGWAQLVGDPDRRAKPERAARAIAAHLLDAGYSPRYLHRWWTYRVRHEPGTRTLGDLLLEAHQLATKSPIIFDVLIAFRRAPVPNNAEAPQWLNAADISEWLQLHGHEAKDVRQVGGLLLSIEALDPYAAVEQAAEAVDRLSARAAIGSRIPLEPLDHVWVKGEKSPTALRESRRVEVHAIEREKKIYHLGPSSKVDRALELLSQLEHAPPGPAVAGGWAAVETLLAGPGDGGKAVLADRLAALVACSFPRAELTSVAWTYQQKGGDALAGEIAGCASNIAKARRLAEALMNDRPPATLASPSDLAAVGRMRRLLQNPAVVTQDIRAHVTRAFRRLYRQRNLVLHWGMTDAVSLSACLRTAAPLIGAGVDRIVHAWFVHGLDPLEASARAENGLALLGPGSGARVLDLLE